MLEGLLSYLQLHIDSFVIEVSYIPTFNNQHSKTVLNIMEATHSFNKLTVAVNDYDPDSATAKLSYQFSCWPHPPPLRDTDWVHRKVQTGYLCSPIG